MGIEEVGKGEADGSTARGRPVGEKKADSCLSDFCPGGLAAPVRFRGKLYPGMLVKPRAVGER